MKNQIAFALFALLCACGAPQPNADAHRSPDVRNAWASPTPGGVDVSAGYLTIINETGAEDRLVGASSPRAAEVSVHEMSMDGGVMRMRMLDGLPIPAGAEITLEPGGLHLMFMGVTQPFTEGEEIAVQLTFANAGAVDVTMPVRRSPPGQQDGR
jgi:copper(I)-binding protein